MVSLEFLSLMKERCMPWNRKVWAEVVNRLADAGARQIVLDLVFDDSSEDEGADEAFKLAVDTVDYGDFTRAKRGTGTDPANRFLDHGNYLAALQMIKMQGGVFGAVAPSSALLAALDHA